MNRQRIVNRISEIEKEVETLSRQFNKELSIDGINKLCRIIDGKILELQKEEERLEDTLEYYDGI